MSIKHGTADVKRYLGTSEINKAYLGTVVVLGDGSPPSAFDSTAFSADSIGSGTQQSFADFLTDGSANISAGSFTPASPRWWSSSPPATWVSYSRTGSGTIIGGLTAGVRYQLNATRQIGIERASLGLNTSTFTLDFYDAASGGSLVGTKTFTTSVEVT